MCAEQEVQWTVTQTMLYIIEKVEDKAFYCVLIVVDLPLAYLEVML